MLARLLQQGVLGADAGSLTAGSLTAMIQQAGGWGLLSPQQHQQQQQQQQRCKHSVRMVLLKDHERLGRAGNIVKVKAGHARYTLFPRGEADYALPSVLRQLKARGGLSPAALELMAQGFKEQRGAAAVVDPAQLPPEQQLPQITQLLSDSVLVVSRRFNSRHPEQPLLEPVTARHLAAQAARQLKVLLPEELIMMHRHSPITSFGSFKVPLNLKDQQGNQVELSVTVQKTHKPSGTRRQLQQLFALKQQQQQQQESAS